MPNANLPIADGVTSAFSAAQNADSATRFIKVVITEESLSLDCQGDCAGSAQDDFPAMVSSSIRAEEACLVLYCLTDEGEASGTIFNTGSLSIGCAAKAKEWSLLCFIPESSKVRDKMLYSACREDIKAALGRPLFSRDYGADTVEEMTWTAFKGDAVTDKSIYVSEKERVIQESDAASNAERSGVIKSNVIAMLPFDFTEDVTSALSTLQDNIAGRSSATGMMITVLELYMHDETFSLTGVDAPTDVGKGKGMQEVAAASVSSFSTFINSEHGRFYVIHSPAAAETDEAASKVLHGMFFVYSCPDCTPVRTRMTLSSSKATMLAKLDEAGMRFTKCVEIREPADIDDYLSASAATSPDTADDAVEAGSAAAVMTRAKPAVRGRAGTRKVSKFVTEQSTGVASASASEGE